MYLLSFCPPKSIINSFSHIQFLGSRGSHFVARKSINKISCFLSSFTHPIEFFLLKYFFNILALHVFNFEETMS